MVASYVLDPSRRQHSLDALALDLFGHRMIPYSEVAELVRDLSEFDEDDEDDGYGGDWGPP